MDLARYVFAAVVMWLIVHYVRFLELFGVQGRRRGYIINYLAAKYAYQELLIYIDGVGGEIWNIREQRAEKENVQSIVKFARECALEWKRELKGAAAS